MSPRIAYLLPLTLALVLAGCPAEEEENNSSNTNNNNSTTMTSNNNNEDMGNNSTEDMNTTTSSVEDMGNINDAHPITRFIVREEYNPCPEDVCWQFVQIQFILDSARVSMNNGTGPAGASERVFDDDYDELTTLLRNDEILAKMQNGWECPSLEAGQHQWQLEVGASVDGKDSQYIEDIGGCVGTADDPTKEIRERLFELGYKYHPHLKD